MSSTVGKVWDRASINELLMTNDKAVSRALIILLARQTAEEQNSGETLESNGKGFTGADASILTSLAQQIKQGRTLSVKQMAICRKLSKHNGVCKLAKYWQQLAAEIPAKQARIENAKTVAAEVMREITATEQRCVVQPVRVHVETSDWGSWS